MIIDARRLLADETLQAEVCIIGGGVAGLTIAQEFINQKIQVCLIESGGFDLDQTTDSLSEGTVIGDRYPAIPETRSRALGGTAHLWEAELAPQIMGWRALPLDEIDFEQRDWLPYSGWSISRSDLDPYYERSHPVCQLGAFTYQSQDWESKSARRFPLNSDVVTTNVSQYAPRSRFTQDLPQRICSANNIQVLLYTNVTELITNDAGTRIDQARVSCLQGKSFWVRAKIFILAAGGIDNAKLLLLSNQHNARGIGNEYDLVGRFFMEHPSVYCGHLIPARKQFFDQADLYEMRQTQRGFAIAFLQLNERLMRQQQLLNHGIQLYPKPHPHHQLAQQSLSMLARSVKQGQLPEKLGWHCTQIIQSSSYFTQAAFWKLVRSLAPFKRGIWSYLPYEKRRFAHFELIHQLEQAPDPNNRVCLNRDRDALGQNKVELHWKLNAIDLEAIQSVQRLLQAEFQRTGLGTVQLPNSLQFFKYSGHHHMGTTRMHSNPKQGVVDSDCRVHSVNNLFVSGSSVFPTSGHANPTLTIVALAIRLADHLKALMR